MHTTSTVIPFAHSLTHDAALSHILRGACEVATQAGVLRPDEAFHLQRVARGGDCSALRRAIELVIALRDVARQAQADRHEKASVAMRDFNRGED